MDAFSRWAVYARWAPTRSGLPRRGPFGRLGRFRRRSSGRKSWVHSSPGLGGPRLGSRAGQRRGNRGLEMARWCHGTSFRLIGETTVGGRPEVVKQPTGRMVSGVVRGVDCRRSDGAWSGGGCGGRARAQNARPQVVSAAAGEAVLSQCRGGRQRERAAGRRRSARCLAPERSGRRHSSSRLLSSPGHVRRAPRPVSTSDRRLVVAGRRRGAAVSAPGSGRAGRPHERRGAAGGEPSEPRRAGFRRAAVLRRHLPGRRNARRAPVARAAGRGGAVVPARPGGRRRSPAGAGGTPLRAQARVPFPGPAARVLPAGRCRNVSPRPNCREDRADRADSWTV